MTAQIVETWYSMSLGDGMMAAVPSAEIEERFKMSFIAAGRPANIAYFSPAASEVAQAVDAEPCDAPARTGLGLLAGDPGCWSMLFPENTA